jgi:hypothetical protein
MKKRINEFIRCIRERGYDLVENDIDGQVGEIHRDGESLCILFENGELSTNAYRELSLLNKNIKEYLKAFENAESIEANGLIDGYKKLLEFNGKSVNIGRYFNDYESAKENMALRSGMLDESKLFSETDLKLIRSSLVAYVALDENLDHLKEKAIGRILDQIDIVVPEIVNHQKYEDRELVSDDGLEL